MGQHYDRHEHAAARAPRLGHRGQWRPRRRTTDAGLTGAASAPQTGRPRSGERLGPASPTLA